MLTHKLVKYTPVSILVCYQFSETTLKFDSICTFSNFIISDQ